MADDVPPPTAVDFGLGISSSPEDAPLLDELASLTVDGIRRRAPELDAVQEGLRAQIKELASASCGVFIESAACVKRVHGELARVAQHLEALEAKLPQTIAQVEAHEGIEERRRNVLLHEKHA